MKYKKMLGCLAAVMALAVCPVTVKAQNYVVVDKPNNMIFVYDQSGKEIFKAPVTVGQNYGQKTRVGDKKTPEGTFAIKSIENASSWTHDFKDGGGVRKGAYGPFFHRLRVPGNNSIGIHGTCFPERIGQRGSEGCIRLNNDDLVKFNKLVKVGTKVTVLPDLPESQRAGKLKKQVSATQDSGAVCDGQQACGNDCGNAGKPCDRPAEQQCDKCKAAAQSGQGCENPTASEARQECTGSIITNPDGSKQAAAGSEVPARPTSPSQR